MSGVAESKGDGIGIISRERHSGTSIVCCLFVDILLLDKGQKFPNKMQQPHNFCYVCAASYTASDSLKIA